MPATSIGDVSISYPGWQQIFQVLIFQGGYNTNIVVFAASLLGFAAGIVGSFALLRKRAMMGDALAHSALPGLAVAYLLAYFLGAKDFKQISVLLFGAAVLAFWEFFVFNFWLVQLV